MKGLLLKDIYVLQISRRPFLICLGLFVLCQLLPFNSIFLNAYPVLIYNRLLYLLLSRDETSGWTAYSTTFPVPRSSCVSCKYLLIVTGACSLPLLSAPVRTVALLWSSSAFEEYFTCTALSLLLFLLPTSVVLPFVFRYGIKKCAPLYWIAESLSFIVLLLLEGIRSLKTKLRLFLLADGYNERTDGENFELMEQLFENKQPLVPNDLLTVLLIAAVLLFALSWLLSVRLCKKREF